MDKVTQQSAAMIEETAAAGGRLAQEAAALAELVDEFTFRESDETEFLDEDDEEGMNSYEDEPSLAEAAE